MSEHRDEQDAGPGPGAWAVVRTGRWSVPVAAVVALVVVVAVVVVALLLRALTTVPGADLEPVGTAVSATPTDTAGGAGDGAGAAGGSRTRGASASAASAGASGSEGAPPEGGAPSAVVVHVVGQVRAPGLVELPAEARVADAVDAAGGLTTEADQSAVNLARPVLDGEQLVVPRPGEVPVPAPGPPPTGAPAPGAGSAGGVAGAPGSPVSLSTATPAELDALPGIGPVLAQRIVDWRDANGGFRSVDELAEVSGIGDAVLEQVRPLVVV